VNDIIKSLVEALAKSENALVGLVWIIPSVAGTWFFFKFVVSPAVMLFKEIILEHRNLVREVTALRETIKRLDDAIRNLQAFCSRRTGDDREG